MEPETAGVPLADELIDQLLPDDFDWREKVRAYPLPAVALATIAGFALGRSRGGTLLAALSSFAASEVSRNLTSVLDARSDSDSDSDEGRADD